MAIDIATIKDELRRLAERNLDAATFQERMDVTARLGIKVCPSEDLKTMKIKCGLALYPDDNVELSHESGCRIVTLVYCAGLEPATP